MSGHSKWAQIRRSKGVNDARRGQLFTRLGREIVVAVREGNSGDPNANFRLRIAVQRARDANMRWIILIALSSALWVVLKATTWKRSHTKDMVWWYGNPRTDADRESQPNRRRGTQRL
ncbi:YebC/PmpR family DNA-binding transcriptional regulator [Dictyobacter formicarum]|uniref:YebC/PmpR family DNA-binding transcriptional regulator n=1 Tax=Dictyobacter formicarum TaxID=2778368 RepID=UPI0019158D7C|nr:YebC/PmpR family DNA-binding transcriptional regulator [Dictyobacter formicarum]